jgi:hypothetical protein
MSIFIEFVDFSQKYQILLEKTFYSKADSRDKFRHHWCRGAGNIRSGEIENWMLTIK